MSQDAVGPDPQPSPFPSQNASGVWPPPPMNQPDNGWGPLMLPFNETSPLARWLAGLLIGNIVGDVIGMVVDPLRSSTGQIASGLASILEFLLLIVTGIVFLLWSYRSYKNLTVFGAAGLRMTPGWVVASFFIPVLSLSRPYTAFAEIWQASTPGLLEGDNRAWKAVRTSPILMSWWLLWLLTGISGYASAFAAQDDAVSPLAVLLTEGDHIVSIAAAACAILVVQRITARQAAKWKEIAARRPASVPPLGYPTPGAVWAG